jgi:L-seryl-tRNA(Ser) seleniumtransferase
VTPRDLPSVDAVAERLRDVAAPRALIVAETRRVLAEMRRDIHAGGRGADGDVNLDVDGAVEASVRRGLTLLARPALQRVINTTGVILHTNLGRAPLAEFTLLTGYSNLEFDLETGRRGKRDTLTSRLLERLTGKLSIVVNNNAAAILLVLHTLARGGEVIVSRGELIEIGDGFRIPDIMAASGAKLREVGATNRTHIDDYRNAIGPRTRLLLRVHPSNFRIEGFASQPSLAELAALARERGLPLYEDLGSGCVVDLQHFGIREPRVSVSLDAGVSLVSFSGDKLLGGPQAGVLSGDPELIERLRRNHLYRALRADKLILQALETTLRALVFERWDQIPALRMIRATAAEIRARAEHIRALCPKLELVPGQSVAGGGSTPGQTLDTWLLAVPGNARKIERTLRSGTPPVIARIEGDRVVLDLRTVFPEEEAELVRALEGLR